MCVMGWFKKGRHGDRKESAEASKKNCDAAGETAKKSEHAESKEPEKATATKR